jgi:hypothetical protein
MKILSRDVATRSNPICVLPVARHDFIVSVNTPYVSVAALLFTASSTSFLSMFLCRQKRAAFFQACA